MLKIKRGKETRWCFPEVSESRHSPLVLVGAPTQGCSSPLIHTRIKCSLQANSLILRHGESPTTAHNMTWVIHKFHRMITKLPTTKPSRWWRSPRVTSVNSHLIKASLMRKVDAHLLLLCTNKILNLELSNLKRSRCPFRIIRFILPAQKLLCNLKQCSHQIYSNR